jgi:aminoglycoside phosphotransferase (APT) family kinase protein
MIAITPHILKQIVERMTPGGRLLDAQALVGGASAQVMSMHIAHGDGGTQTYLVRAHSDVDRMRNPEVASHEFKLLQVLHGLGLPVAQPIYLDATGEIMPIPYLVVAYIEGTTVFSPQDLPDFLRQSAQLLVTIHQSTQNLSRSRSDLGFLSDRAAHVLWWLGYQPEQLDDEIDEGRLRATLRAMFPLRQVNAMTLLHGDFWAGNLIWRGGKLVGVIDWEDAEMGDPLSDLAIARLDILWAFGKAAMQDFTQAYQSLMPHLDYGNLPCWDLFSALRPAGQLGEWAALWARLGRPDVTLATMREAHAWFVDQALRRCA